MLDRGWLEGRHADTARLWVSLDIHSRWLTSRANPGFNSGFLVSNRIDLLLLLLLLLIEH